MPTPNTYDFSNFKEILSNANNLFHQTSIANLPLILSQNMIVSPATQWGMKPKESTERYLINNQRLNNLKKIADRGFIDYVFCSFKNGIERQDPRYGTVSIEINKSILIERESFIYPFNFIFGWPGSDVANRFSDLSTWNTVIKDRNTTYNEVLVRRKVDLKEYLVKIHCFEGIASRVMAILKEAGYNHYMLEVHQNVPIRGNMENESIAKIEGVEYKALISADGKFASIYNLISNDDLDFLGRYSVVGNELIEIYPMTNKQAVIGTLTTEPSSKLA